MCFTDLIGWDVFKFKFICSKKSTITILPAMQSPFAINIHARMEVQAPEWNQQEKKADFHSEC